MGDFGGKLLLRCSSDAISAPLSCNWPPRIAFLGSECLLVARLLAQCIPLWCCRILNAGVLSYGCLLAVHRTGGGFVSVPVAIAAYNSAKFAKSKWRK